MPTPPSLVYPVAPSYFIVGREFTPATLSTAPLFGVKAAAFKPVNKPTWLKDNSLWGDMAKLHDLQQGPRWGEHDIPESPLYGDTIGAFLFNLFGDYTTTGTAGTPTWTASGAISAGAGPIAVTTGSVASSGTYIQVDTGVNAEVVKVGTGSTSTSIVLDATTPLRFSHLTAVTLTTVTGPYTHTFALLNPGATAPNAAACQPPSHTFWHVNTPAGSGSFSADEFLYGCLSEITITGKADGWLSWSGKVTSYTQQAPGSAPSGAPSTVKGIPAWRSSNTEASSSVNDIAMWTATWTREMDVISTADGVQNPYFIGRGQMNAAFKLTVDPAVDESQLTHMLSNDQPTLSWTASNGLSGTNVVSLTVNSQLAGYQTANLTAQKSFFGYEIDGEFVTSATGAGNSGGTTPSQLVLTNNIPTY